jgi:hypothetical protein
MGTSALFALLLGACPGPPADSADSSPSSDTGSVEETVFYDSHAVLAWPARGMSPMDASYATVALRPPAVGLRALVLQRGVAVSPGGAGMTLSYEPLDPSAVTGETDFWQHAPALLGDEAPAEGMGLGGQGLTGELSDRGDGLGFSVQSLPVVPTSGSGEVAPFPLFRLRLTDQSGDALAATVVVAPTSWDRACDRCHGDDPAGSILAAHDTLHDSTLAAEAPVRCGACHAQPELGWAGDGEASVLATAMHGAHRDRMSAIEDQLEVTCLACHPGPDTPWYRGNHSERGVACTDCHGGMEALLAEGRQPWRDLPRCEDCHATIGSEYQQPGVSFGDSVGHGGLGCPACHHSAHGLYSSTLEADNAQNQGLQGYAGVISTCRVCHDPNPGGLFPHVVDP